MRIYETHVLTFLPIHDMMPRQAEELEREPAEHERNPPTLFKLPHLQNHRKSYERERQRLDAVRGAAEERRKLYFMSTAREYRRRQRRNAPNADVLTIEKRELDTRRTSDPTIQYLACSYRGKTGSCDDSFYRAALFKTSGSFIYTTVLHHTSAKEWPTPVETRVEAPVPERWKNVSNASQVFRLSLVG